MYRECTSMRKRFREIKLLNTSAFFMRYESLWATYHARTLDSLFIRARRVHCLGACNCGYTLYVHEVYARCLHHYLNNPHHRECMYTYIRTLCCRHRRRRFPRHYFSSHAAHCTRGNHSDDRRRKPRFNPFSPTQNETPYCDRNDFNTIAFTRPLSCAPVPG